MAATRPEADNRYSGRLIPSGRGFSALNAFQKALTLLADFRVAVPYLIYFLVQIAVMLVYIHNKSETATSLWAILLGGIPRDVISHYPEHLILMLPVLNRFDMILDIVLRIVFHGATVCLVAAAISGSGVSVAKSFAASGRRYFHLLLISIVSSAAVYISIYVTTSISSGQPGPAGLLIKGSGIGAALVIQLFFLYTTPFIVIGGRSAVRAVKEGFMLSGRSFGRSLAIVTVPFILTIPATFLSMKADIIALQLSPDLMIHIHVASKVMELISTYLLTAAAAVVFLTGTQPAKRSV
jgi:hypothetical protein